jgi:hypothetical protein
MTDLELVNKYCEECLDYVSPLLFRDIERRGLGPIINYLPNNVEEAKSVAYARMQKAGKAWGDPEIDKIAGEIQMINAKLKELNAASTTDVHKTIPILQEMLVRSQLIRDYFKQ